MISMNTKIYKGVIVPMITPIHEDLSIDHGAVEKILDAFLEYGAAPFPLGTTGEAVSLSNAQKTDLVKKTVEHVNRRTPVFAGISGTSLTESIENAKTYAGIGVDVVVVHLPFYFPISSAAMLKYFEQLADGIDCPLVLYNMPAMVRESIPLDVAERLSHHPNIVGMKDSERSMERLDESIRLWSKRSDFAFYLGWAAQSAYSVRNGADGIVPSTANLTPGLYRDLYEAAAKGHVEESERLQQVTNRISELYQKDRNLSQSLPALKTLMSEYELCKPHMMPPMYELEIEEQTHLKAAIRAELKDIVDFK